ncbi:MAG: glycosyltransferase [Rhodospirillaceae bacterium]|nr:glycosyltransferase [Rhodospirillaceae bacterium]
MTYIGNVTRAKLHPDFFALSDTVAGDAIRFPVAGGALDPAFAQRHAATRRPERFLFPGFVADIASLLGASAVFGYPLAPDTYASLDRSLQEAMWAGVPPVLIARSGPDFAVADRETGRIAAGPADYPRLVAELIESPAERRRLGDGAAAHARLAFDPLRNIERLRAVLARAMEQPRRQRAPLFAAPAGGTDAPAAYRFARCLGSRGAALVESILDPSPRSVAGAIGALRALSPLARAGEGGLVHFRNWHPEDVALRCWAGIVLADGGDVARAAAEIDAAQRLGGSDMVCSAYRRALGASAAVAPIGGD